MRKTTLVSLAVLALASSTAGAAPVLKDGFDAQVRPLIEGQWVTGLVIGVIGQSGKELVYGYGRVALDGPARAPDGDTLFEIGSASKVFTSLMLADLVERKRVSLDDPIAKWLPPTVKVPSWSGHAITLAHLSTHTSGLPRLPLNLAPKDPGNPYADYTVEQLYAFLSSYTLTREPGTVTEYSNLGAGLLGHLVALIDKSTYEALLTERIAKPLKMTSTRITLTAADRARFAEPHDASGAVVPAWDLPVLAGAGAIRSTANDLLRFLRANLGLDPSPLTAAMKLERERRLAWQFRDDGRTIWHNGQTGGFHSYLAFDPEKKIAVVVLANSAAGVVDDLGYQVLRALRGETVQVLDLKPRVRPVFPLTPAQLDAYVGAYELRPGFVLDVRRVGDHLVVQATGQPTFPMFAESATHFYLRAVPADLDFHDDVLTLRQSGHELSGRRKPR
jgi:D-alanyl-D-alanine-carboxypeptidase/D-alanyl-D-alanine-endopeptidase